MRQPTLRKRSEFLRVRGGARWSTPTVTIEARPRPVVGVESQVAAPSTPPTEPSEANAEPARVTVPARFGFTVTKKLGGAVKRNRIRRRLKAAVDELAGSHCRPGFDYVLVARAAALTCPYGALKKDLEAAFQRVHHPRREKRRT